MDTKTKRRTPPREPGYHRLTDEKRIIIETLRKEGRSLSYIAERIGCNKSTVSKEIKRNKGNKGYRNKKAQGMARSRVAAKAAKRFRWEAVASRRQMATVIVFFSFTPTL